MNSEVVQTKTPHGEIPPGENPTVQSHPLRQWRVRTGVSQPTLARQIGVSVSMINRWERGLRLTSPATMESLIDATGIENLPTIWHRWYVDTIGL